MSVATQIVARSLRLPVAMELSSLAGMWGVWGVWGVRRRDHGGASAVGAALRIEIRQYYRSSCLTLLTRRHATLRSTAACSSMVYQHSGLRFYRRIPPLLSGKNFFCS